MASDFSKATHKTGNNGKTLSGDSRRDYETKDFIPGQADVRVLRLKKISFNDVRTEGILCSQAFLEESSSR